MNRQRIREILIKPSGLSYSSDYPVVKELAENFPYFPTLHVILSKLLQQENSIYFDKSLKLGAAYIGNRELLYDYIKEKTVAGHEEIQVISDQQEAVIEAVAPSADIANENEVAVAEEVPGVIEKEPAKAIPEKELFSYAVYDYFGQYYKKEKAEALQDKEKESETKSEAEIISGPHSFSEWFDILDALKHKEVKKQVKDEAPEVGQNESISLIDKFIQAEPRIKPQQTKMYNPEDMARKSVKEDFSMATETLANIFLKQGLKHKAIEIFQQLILKYPQKSGYFADKIRETESESLS